MANLSKQYSSFLGGEVSSRLYHRADMDKFGKWFANAENIRFRETGSFYNRCGFSHVHYTKDAIPQADVCLLPFSFNDEQSFLVELGSSLGKGYARFYHNGNPIIVNNAPYEIESPFNEIQGQTFKTAQAGDILFITNKKYGIYELRRLKKDGSEWEFKKFTSKTMPMGDLEGEEGYYLTSTSASFPTDSTYTVTLEDWQDLDSINSPELLINGNSVYDSSSILTISQLITAINAALQADYSSVTAAAFNRNIVFSCSNWATAGVTSITLTIAGDNIQYTDTISNADSKYISIDARGIVAIDKITLKSGSTLTTYGTNKQGMFGYITSTKTITEDVIKNIAISPAITTEQNFSDVLSVLSELSNFRQDIDCGYLMSPRSMMRGGPLVNRFFTVNTGKWLSSSITDDKQIIIEQSPTVWNWKNSTQNLNDAVYGARSHCKWTGFNLVDIAAGELVFEIRYYKSVDRQYNAVFHEGETESMYHFTSAPVDNKFFSQLKSGDTFAVKNHMEAEDINQSITVGTGTTSTAVGNGEYRYYTSGNWTGSIEVQFSLDKGATWKTLHTISSGNENAPGNDNTSGSIESDDLVRFRAQYNILSGSVAFVFETSPYDIWSYYQIYQIINDREAYVRTIKNDVGTIFREEEYKKNAFSDTLSYPSVIGFYQNRLFLGKDYMVYGSAINDFWNFYMRAQNLQDDDAMDISLLSAKVNNIKNIITDKSFFAFTGGGEFGIGADGAITQADKFLKQFSSHGSSDVDPVLTGDLVVFVDKTNNTTRALQYSLQTDNYEATDVSIFLREKLESEEIIKTAYSYVNKEAYFLTRNGIIFVMKYLPEQNILAWSHWKHASFLIKDICVVPNGAEEDIYVIVSSDKRTAIERLNKQVYLDSSHVLNNDTAISSILTTFDKDREVTVVSKDNHYYVLKVGDDGVITLPTALQYVSYGLAYTSDATLLTPTIQQEDQTFTTYYLQKPYKVRFIHTNSYGFKVGEQTEEKFQIEWQDPATDFDDEQVLTSGFKSVSIVSKFGYDKRISFVQGLPYPMDIQNVFIETDFGGK